LAVDVSMELDLEPSGRTDRFRDTIDYRRVHQRVIELGRGSSHRLLESFAVTLIDALLAEFPALRVTVAVRKETPVLDGIVDSVGVELSRERKPRRPA
jgi:dihydroneopterin aldolase